MRIFTTAMVALGLLAPSRATTLQKLDLEEMIQKSTAIVRARIVSSNAAFLGGDIYTYYHVQVLEGWKTAARELDVAVPGGAARGMRQLAAGAPTPNIGDEYVIFLWTSRSGLTQVIGLSQGLFTVKLNPAGDAVLIRPAATDLMLDKAGKVIGDRGVTIRLNDLRAEIGRVLGAAK